MIGVSSEIESRKINWDQHVTQARFLPMAGRNNLSIYHIMRLYD